MRWSPWLVRTVIFGGLGLLLIISVGGRVRADRALNRANTVADMGTPGMVAARAQQAMSVWAGEPAVVVSVEREQRHWRAVAMAGGACYELAVSGSVSAHPGLVPCPPVSAAGSADTPLSGLNARHAVVSGFLDAWLRGDSTADRYLADERPALPTPPRPASDVKVLAVYGDADEADEPGGRSVVTATAEATFDGRVESLAWTFLVVRGDTRWSVEQVAGGEIPTGSAVPLTVGRGVAEADG